MVVSITNEELAIVSTAIMIVQKDAERRRGFVLCTDGKLRRLGRQEAVDLIDRIGTLAGHERGFLKTAGLQVAKEGAR